MPLRHQWLQRGFSSKMYQNHEVLQQKVARATISRRRERRDTHQVRSLRTEMSKQRPRTERRRWQGAGEAAPSTDRDRSSGKHERQSGETSKRYEEQQRQTRNAHEANGQGSSGAPVDEAHPRTWASIEVLLLRLGLRRSSACSFCGNGSGRGARSRRRADAAGGLPDGDALLAGRARARDGSSASGIRVRKGDG